MVDHYSACEMELSRITRNAGRFSNLFDMYSKLANVLSRKARIGSALRQAYANHDREKLSEMSSHVLPSLKESILAFKQSFSKVWFSESKGHGFEVIDIRLGGLVSRADTVIARLNAYLTQEITEIEELEEAALPFTQGAYSDEAYVCFNLYKDIATQNILG